MDNKNVKKKLYLVAIVTLSIVTSHTISYKWHKPLGLKKNIPEMVALAAKTKTDLDQKEPTTPKVKNRHQQMFEAMPLKCMVGNLFTLSLGRSRDRTIYMAKYIDPNDVNKRNPDPKYKYIELNQHGISGRGYVLKATSIKYKTKISLDYEISNNSEIYLHLNKVKEFINGNEYGDIKSICKTR